jgi:hypothetical protein
VTPPCVGPKRLKGVGIFGTSRLSLLLQLLLVGAETETCDAPLLLLMTTARSHAVDACWKVVDERARATVGR